MASVDGPLPNDTVTYVYDELGRVLHRSLNGVDISATYDAAGRITRETNALGAFSIGYDGSSARIGAEAIQSVES